MAGHESLTDDNDRRVIDERGDRGPRTGQSGRILLFLLVVGALVVGGFFLLGGSADVDTEGDIEVPEVDLDVNAPDVDVNSEDAPPASADAESDDTSSN